MIYQIKSCQDCTSIDFVTNYREGDVTCRNCGLIQQERILVDEIFYNQTSYEENNILHSENDNITIHQLIGDLLVIPQIIEEESSKLLKSILIKYRFKGQPLKAAVACCIYISFNNQGSSIFQRDAKEIYKPLQIEPHVFNKTLRQIYKIIPIVKKANVLQSNNSLMRQIQSCSGITKSKRWDIAKEVRRLESYKTTNHLLLGSPPSVVNIIVIFVACVKMNIQIDKTSYIEEMKISRATLDKHIKLFDKFN